MTPNIEQRLKEIPPEPGVYFMRDATDRILYIGKSKRLRSRVRSYFRDGNHHSPRIAMMVRQVAEIEFIVTDTEAEALALEANLIKQHQPYFNVLLKDDKKYPYILITWSEDYPRILMTRNRRIGRGKDKYYGPYTDAHLLRNVLYTIKRTFPLRQRPQPLFKDRPCLNYDLGRCPGVCQSMIAPQDYHQTVEKVAMIFQGRTGELLETLATQMQQASERLDFEQAGTIRDRLNNLAALNAEQKVALPNDTVSRDAIALAADRKTACVQLFQIRAGKLIGRLGFTAQVQSLSAIETADPSPEDLGAILQSVLEEHYRTADSVEIPAEILVQHPLPDGDILASYLSDLKGRKVTIVNPQRQLKAELIEMVEKNAVHELTRLQRQSERNLNSLEDLAEILSLPEMPRRIEGFDISHIQGSNAVASQVVFIDGVPAKQYYRHYKIQNPEITIGHSDDYASHAEIARRRFRKYAGGVNTDSTDFPDVVLIDGGKGQLSAVMNVLEELNLADKMSIISLAKQREEIFLPGETLPLPTEAEQPGVQLLRRVRDESHRFAITFHRQQRSQKQTRSYLDDIAGLGSYRQKQLLAHFHSIDYIRAASVEDLAKAPGIGAQTASEIYSYFHPQ
ncbi:excinuclease ABC subunit UvrC [Chamaesiphon sp. OTE_8_metabat_110]|uniref:excinuclease ABC subunit UvrC n=1 Tax=Chamaesiphon sp. OTE_8_metabat_110 TaxID=2964696 RepID=UPI00286AEEC1|nr:excinuclease ABC subunit UvrC [Chamaesiphon sp. OTE_8_metabat_110]